MLFKPIPGRTNNRNAFFRLTVAALIWFFSVWFVMPLGAAVDLWSFIPDTAAAVDQRIITRKRLVEKLLQADALPHYRSLSPVRLREAALDCANQMVGRILLEEAFEQEKIKVSDAEIRSRFAEMMENMTSSQRETLYTRLRQQKIVLQEYVNGIVKDEDTRFDLALRKLIELKFPGRLDVSDDDCERYYRENQTLFEMPSRVNVSRIFISVEVEKSLLRQEQPKMTEVELVSTAKRNAREKITSVNRQLMAGGDFAALARQFSHCPSAAMNGEIGSFSRGGGLDPVTEKIVFALTPGVVSNICEVEDGYQLLKVNRVISPGYAPVSEVKNFIREDLQNRLVAKLAEKIVRDAKRHRHIFIYF